MGNSNPEVRTHGVSAYRDYKCRCDVCRAAVAAKKRRQRFDRLIPVQPLIDRFGEAFVKQHPISMKKWLREGINVYAADKICCARGFHPIEVFGDIWIDHALNKDKEKEND